MKPTIVLGVICLVSALLLALVNVITGPIIAANQNAAANEALLEVLPDGKNFEEIELGDKYPKAITKGYKADGGYVFQATVTGKSSGLVIMCGINSDGKVVGTKVIAEQETDSYDVNVFPYVEGLDGEYKDQTLEGFTPYLVSGATLTSAAYSEAIKASLQAAAIAGGADVDTRTPEQILQDSCNEALGTTGLSFTKWFRVEVIEGVDAVYESTEGRVYVIGEAFVGVKAGSVVGTDISAEDSAAALAADGIIEASVLTKITDPDLIGALDEKKFVEAYSSASGNYVIVTNGDGYGMKGPSKYYPSRKPIVVKVSIDSNGRIIDTMVVSEHETADIGGLLLNNSEFIDSFDNKTKEDYSTVEGSSGATMTANGYKDAIAAAFAAYELLTGGN